MATAGGGGAIVKPLFVMVGLIENQAMAELMSLRERSTLLCLVLNLGCVWLQRKCKKVWRNFFSSHPSIILFYFLDVNFFK